MFIYIAQRLSELAGRGVRIAGFGSVPGTRGGPSQRDREAVFRDACIRQVRGDHVGIKREIQAGSRGVSRPAARGAHRVVGQ